MTKQKPKKKSPARTSKKKLTPAQVATNGIMNLMQLTPMVPTPDKVSTSKALVAVRTYDFKKSPEAYMEFSVLLNKYRSIIMRNLMDDIMDTDWLRVMDISLIMESLAADVQMLPLWDYENSNAIDEIILNSGLMDEDAEEVAKNTEEVAKNTEAIKKIFDALAQTKTELDQDGGDVDD